MKLDGLIAETASYPYGAGSDKPFYVMDSELTGFGLRLYGSGRKAWVLRYTTRDGRRRFHQIGTFPPMKAKVARKAAEDLLATIQLGGDPAGERKETREAPTVADLCAEFVERYAKPHRKSVAEDERRIKNYIKPAWGPRKAASITQADMTRLHLSLAERGHREANQVANLVRRIWALGREWGLVDGSNPGIGVKRFKEHSRDRWLSPAEVTALLAEIDAEVDTVPEAGSLSEKAVRFIQAQGTATPGDVAATIGHPKDKTTILLASLVQQGRLTRPETGVYAVDPDGERWRDLRAIYIRSVLWLYLLCGCRKMELLTAKWSFVDWDRKELRLPTTKTGEPAKVPLSAPALEILKSIPREADNPYIFPSPRRGPNGEPMHMANIWKRWDKIRTRAKLENVRIHDLRRTMGSMLASKGNSLLVVQKAMHHKSYQAALIYGRLSEDPIRGAVEDHGQSILELAGKKTAGEVVALRGRR